MKNSTDKSSIIPLIALVLAVLLLPVVFAGVTSPLPSDIELTRESSERFKFQIQAVQSEQDLVCSYSFSEEPPFDVEFDEPETVVEAGSRVNVYGTVSPTDETSFGTHTADFCVSCRPVDAPPGASVAIDTCGLPLKVTLVEQRTRENLNVPDKDESYTPYLALVIALVMIAVAVIALVVFAWLRRKHKLGAHARLSKKKSKGKSRKK